MDSFSALREVGRHLDVELVDLDGSRRYLSERMEAAAPSTRRRPARRGLAFGIGAGVFGALGAAAVVTALVVGTTSPVPTPLPPPVVGGEAPAVGVQSIDLTPAVGQYLLESQTTSEVLVVQENPDDYDSYFDGLTTRSDARAAIAIEFESNVYWSGDPAVDSVHEWSTFIYGTEIFGDVDLATAAWEASSGQGGGIGAPGVGVLEPSPLEHSTFAASDNPSLPPVVVAGVPLPDLSADPQAVLAAWQQGADTYGPVSGRDVTNWVLQELWYGWPSPADVPGDVRAGVLTALLELPGIVERSQRGDVLTVTYDLGHEQRVLEIDTVRGLLLSHVVYPVGVDGVVPADRADQRQDFRYEIVEETP